MGKPHTAVVRAANDRSIPTEYVGTIEPNYYCRGWNAKRVKYCRYRAGAGTIHRGQGRCKHHGGQQEKDARVKSGKYSTIQTEEIRQLVEQLAENTDPLDVVEELLIAKAYLRVHIKDDGAIDDVMTSVDTISKVIHRIEQARAAYALSRPEFLRIMTEMGRQVEAHVSELGRQLTNDTEHQLDVAVEFNATLKRIRDGWLSIRL